MKKVYVLLADGFEVIEALAPVDIMRRAGIEVITLSLNNNLEVMSSHNIKVMADKIFDGEFKDGDGIYFPGGYPGYENLLKSQKAMELGKYYLENNKLVGAICGAPSSLARAGVIDGKNITLHFGCYDLVGDKCNIIDKPIVVDGNLITGSGAGYSVDMGLALVNYLVPEKVADVKKALTIKD
ncbi:MAG: DJ-1/PfpI family protein [Fusobacterium perfoetens]|uniref:DJ-1/PfpI family protein n=1 Tax=Fusobacterium perfoetens TaxID=852 RepID=UPI0023F2DF1E|nr:DJ-1/PfpI family protein [Fusobacterium perfoetens]MCI6152055.1 DJ-1/PfpI family protein [Fusobacterium perfoetens]MDY3238054.1 DJ-1/PfpI family protein [Fusobacterium perfoetens]